MQTVFQGDSVGKLATSVIMGSYNVHALNSNRPSCHAHFLPEGAGHVHACGRRPEAHYAAMDESVTLSLSDLSERLFSKPPSLQVSVFTSGSYKKS